MHLSRLEVGYILRTSFVKGFSTALGVFTERFILFSAVATFVLIGGDIRAQTTFSLVQYFNLMQLACNIILPLALACLAETRVTIRRLEVRYGHYKIIITYFILKKIKIIDIFFIEDILKRQTHIYLRTTNLYLI